MTLVPKLLDTWGLIRWHLQNIYRKATENTYSNLDIDLSQTFPDKYRYKTNQFDKFVPVFIIH